MQDKNKISGSGNTLIGGDYNIIYDDLEHLYKKNLTNIIKSKISGIDEHVNKRLQNGILLSKPQGEFTREKFNSEKIIKSLGLLGVALTAAIEAVSETAQLIDQAIQYNTDITTRLIRGFITESLYGLDENIYGRSLVESWGDKYVRRYGSETEIKIVSIDGQEITLKHDYIRNDIIPTVIADITKQIEPLKDTKYKLLSHSALKKMATEIYDTLTSLNLYRIHYETVCNITKELCTQPPHPWIAPKVRSFQHVNYDFGRTVSNFKKAKGYKSFGKVSKCKYALKEFTHHACSSLLCYYSIYMGCGTLAPLYILYCSIEAILKGDNDKLALLFKLDEIGNDLEKQNISIGKLHITLKKIINVLNDQSQPTPFYIETLFIECEILYNIVIAIVSPFLRVGKLTKIKNFTSPLTRRTIKSLLSDLFMLFPGLEWDHHRQNESYWIYHNYDISIFKNIKESILLVTIQNNTSDINQFIEQWVDSLENCKLTCNTIIFLYDEKYINFSDIQKRNNQDKFVVYFSYQNLIKIATDETPIVEVEKHIRKQIHQNFI